MTAYVGLDVVEHSSGERKAYGGISKAGSRLLRYLLVEAAQTAVHGDEQLRGFYQQVLHRRGQAKGESRRCTQALDQEFYHAAR